MRRRGINVAIAFLLAFVTSPLWVPASIAIALCDGRPVLYPAKRVGVGGKPFVMYKFRTMREGEGPAVTAGDDRRITRLGRVLRATKIDELPQLWNVVRGDMRLVGPRPEDPRFVRLYTDRQRRVLTVPPGITGAGALAFRHEEAMLAAEEDMATAYVEKILPQKLELELAWLEGSPLRDWMILLRSITAVVRVRR